jgi:hypothetical protein
MSTEEKKCRGERDEECEEEDEEEEWENETGIIMPLRFTIFWNCFL